MPRAQLCDAHAHAHADAVSSVIGLFSSNAIFRLSDSSLNQYSVIAIVCSEHKCTITIPINFIV